MRALVTGANGLIGANLMRALISAGHQPTGLVRPTADTSHIDTLPAPLVFGDVLSPETLTAAAAEQDVIFHTAVPFSYWGHDPDRLHRTAIEGSRNVILAASAAGVRRIVMTSSSITLGASYQPDVRNETQDAEDRPNEPAYVQAKIAQEKAALALASQHDIEIIFACPTMSVGPYGASLGPSNSVITSYLADPFHLTWRGGCNIVSVRDVARGHVLLAEKGLSGQRYILGSENLNWADIHTIIASLAGVSPPSQIASATQCYLIALAEEARARVTQRPPLATRAQAKMVGRYYWYSHDQAAALGFDPIPARTALADALAWLSPSPHVDRETRTNMRLAREVHLARATAQSLEQDFNREANE